MGKTPLVVTVMWHNLVPFSKKNLQGHVQTVSGNMYVKFEIRSFKSLTFLELQHSTSAVDRQTHRHTSD